LRKLNGVLLTMLQSKFASMNTGRIAQLAVAAAAACACSILLSGCANKSQSVSTGSAAKEVATPAFIPATAQALAARIVRTAPAYASARETASGCSAAIGAAEAIRFEAPRMLARLAAGDPCGGKFVNREAWVDAKRVEISDAAYAPALARMSEQPGLRIDMAYAGNKIFCDDTQVCRINEPLYANARCYAAPQVAEALTRAAQALVARNATAKLVILDCYRPIYVQERMFSLVNDPVWVAQPKGPRYGGHNRAVAIDLTIEKNGVSLDMGSPFDAFDDRSEHNSTKVSGAARANRAMLRELMIGNGFRPYDAEWWHFSLPIDTPALNFPL
jgi:D-alanyl-D-alanine dipeptidase